MPVRVLCAGPPSLRQYSRDLNSVSPALLKGEAARANRLRPLARSMERLAYKRVVTLILGWWQSGD